jgi:hypothetical protein
MFGINIKFFDSIESPSTVYTHDAIKTNAKLRLTRLGTHVYAF